MRDVEFPQLVDIAIVSKLFKVIDEQKRDSSDLIA